MTDQRSLPIAIIFCLGGTGVGRSVIGRMNDVLDLAPNPGSIDAFLRAPIWRAIALRLSP